MTITKSRRLRTVEGTLAEVLALAGRTGDDLLRVRIRDTPRAVGLAEQVREALPDALEVRIDASAASPASGASEDRRSATDHRRSPHELFAEYLAGTGVQDQRLVALFAELLHDEAAAGADAGSAAGGAR